MTIPANVLAKLATLGLSSEHAEAVAGMLAAVEEATSAQYETVAEATKAKGRERWRRWKDNQVANVSKQLQTTANDLHAGDARVEVKTSNLDIEPQEKIKTRNDASAFQDALRALLDEDRLDALVKHRRARKAPVSAYAAELFIAAARTCGISVAEATDHCIERNWLTVKPDWIAAKPPPRGSPPLRMDDFLGAVIDHQERQNAGPDQKIEGAPQAFRAISGGRRAG